MQMLSRRIVKAAPLRQAALAATRRLAPVVQQRTYIPNSMNSVEVINEKFPEPPSLTEAEDPAMNGGVAQSPPIKRQFRDPHADWWDKQERRNYGEPVHEDYDQLGMLTPFEYTWTTPGKGLLQIGAFVAVFLSVCYTVKLTRPDPVAVPREFEDGLLKELGGAGAVRARSPEDAEAEYAEEL
ncbi:NADH:ubiquinone oxidoreductase subunit [Grosmannia clavigera kw1407]|uniref:NADH:ubiquinone oxidoreductase subunit n=1 Tax=Grosmannia clavigera (strain kw1407 / UAMH 11150) TaxID=655863 RepID=F0XQN8_GROCL|nr:NADH:ubiquinone oxidoreductase subunit [Grosmannia clavigera kw1407]EFX00009.1 NADH:ubiquinone oxidoreductase subunit [Grosmannia clavigera kw1407]